MITSKVKVFFVSEKKDTFAVGEVTKHINGAIFNTGVVGSLTVEAGAKVGDIIDFGQCTLTAVPDPINAQYNRLEIN